MATHSNILAWRIPWTEESGGLQSMGSQSQTQQNNQHTLSEKTSENVFTHHPGLMHLSYFYIFQS